MSCTSPKTLATLSDGSHTFEVRATDGAGNSDLTPATRSFTVDTTAPETTIDSGPTDGSTIDEDEATFGFSSEAGAGFECRLDAASFGSCSSPKSYDGLADGSHTFEVRAVDGVNNRDASPESRTFTVDVPDSQPPETTIGSGPANGSTTTDPTPTFGFSSSEAGSSFKCRVDSASFASCTSPSTVGPLSNGAHTFEVKATDAASNEDPSAASRSFTVDATAPETTIATGPATGTKINDSTPTFGFASSEAGSSFKCRVDSGVFANCTSPSTVGPLSDGLHTFEVRATDAAGNVDATPAARSFTVDATPPNTLITKKPPAVIKSSKRKVSVSFSFQSTELGSTFRCSIDGGAYATCTSPATYSLGRGAHVFKVVAVDSVANADPTPATAAVTIKKKRR